MAWWDKLLKRSAGSSLHGMDYRVVSLLYSEDGKRAAEVRAFANGETYLLESDWVAEGRFEPRHAGRIVGPFSSPLEAERFVVGTDWFRGKLS